MLLYWIDYRFINFAAVASSILSSALVAELIAAPACHMVAPFVLFDPEVALGALLQIVFRSPVDQLLVHLQVHVVDLVCGVANLHPFLLSEDALHPVLLAHQLVFLGEGRRFFASVVVVDGPSTLETPLLFANGAVELLLDLVAFIHEVVVAFRVGTLFHAWDLVTSPLPLEGGESLVFSLGQQILHVGMGNFLPAAVIWAGDREGGRVNLSEDVLFDALDVVNVFASLQDYDFAVCSACEESVVANFADILFLFFSILAVCNK